MVVSLAGWLIDTQDIYAIGPIYKKGDAGMMAFTVRFFNKKETEFSCYAYDIYMGERKKKREENPDILLKPIYPDWDEQMPHYVEIATQRLEKARQTLAYYWNECKPIITQIEI